jgi:hypothetical protein
MHAAFRRFDRHNRRERIVGTGFLENWPRRWSLLPYRAAKPLLLPMAPQGWVFTRSARFSHRGVHPSVGRLIASESQRARDPQHESTVGDTTGSLRSDPAGIMISRPLRVACGSGEPQLRQKEVEKLWAVGRSKRATLSLPVNQRKADGETYAFAANALPVALRQREQWHFTNLRSGRSASNSTSPQRHLPRTDIFHP